MSLRSHPDAPCAHGHVPSLASGRAMRGMGMSLRSHPDAPWAHGHVSSHVSRRAMRGMGPTLTCKARTRPTARACPFTLFAMSNARHGCVRHDQGMPSSTARACPFTLIRHPECATWVHPSRPKDPALDSKGHVLSPHSPRPMRGMRVSVPSKGCPRSTQGYAPLAQMKTPTRRMHASLPLKAVPVTSVCMPDRRSGLCLSTACARPIVAQACAHPRRAHAPS